MESDALPPLSWYLPQPEVPLSKVELLTRLMDVAAAGSVAMQLIDSAAAQITDKMRFHFLKYIMITSLFIEFKQNRYIV